MSSLYIRAAVVNKAFAPEWRWIVWLDDDPPERHWRDGCMLPGPDATNVGVFDDWPAAMRAGAIAFRTANMRFLVGAHGEIDVIPA